MPLYGLYSPSGKLIEETVSNNLEIVKSRAFDVLAAASPHATPDEFVGKRRRKGWRIYRLDVSKLEYAE